MSKLFVLTERPSIYLASKSPRRQELLRQLGIDFTELLLREAAGRRRDVVEAPRKDESPIEYIKRVARTKASVGWHQLVRRSLAPKPVLAADTEVVLDGAVLGKPKDAMGAIDIAASHAQGPPKRGGVRGPFDLQESLDRAFRRFDFSRDRSQ